MTRYENNIKTIKRWNLKKKDFRKNLNASLSKLARAAGLTTKGVIQIPPTIAARMVCRAISANIILSGDPEGTRTLDLLRDRQAF